VKSYLDAHAFSNTETSDLWSALERTSGEPVGSIMKSWIFSGGHPRVSVDVDGPSIHLSQRRFQYRGESDALWEIPLKIKYRTVSGTEALTEVMSGVETTIDVGGDVQWILVNGTDS